MLNLKVFVASSGRTQTMRFNGEMSVHEVCRTIREKVKDGDADHGLFQPPIDKKQPGRWLKPERSLQYYDFVTGAELHYKKKHRIMKIKLLDGTQKSLLLDDSLVVDQLVEHIGKKLKIQNFEEFSLQVEGRPDGQWLNPNQALHDGWVKETDVLLFKKKFSYNDQHVDASDPVQLHLLYVQCRDAILTGKYPCQREEASNLAAIQCQIQMKDYDAKTYRGVPLNEYLAAGWAKDRTIEKDIVKEWQKLVTMTEINAKYRYVQLCRSLKTYGITSFVVEEQQKKGSKKKLVKIVVGVTRDAVLKMDFKTREVYKTYPLTHIRRWAASDKNFTLDFGDYEDEYFACFTQEGDAISQLVAGYIDIILRRRKQIHKIDAEGDGNMASVEVVSPVMGSMATPGVSAFSTGTWDPNTGREMVMNKQAMGATAMSRGPQQAVQAGVMVPGQARQGVAGQAVPCTDLASAIGATQNLVNDLANPGQLAKPGDMNLDQLRQKYTVSEQSVNQACAQLVQAGLAGKPRAQLEGMGMQLGINIGQLVAAAKGMAAESEEEVSLLDGAKAVSEAIQKVLQCSKDLAENPDDPMAKEALRMAQQSYKAAVCYMGVVAQRGELANQPTQDLITESAKVLAAATSNMAAVAKDYTADTPEAEQKEVVDACKKAVMQAKHMLNTTSASVPAITQPGLCDQLEGLADDVGEDTRKILANYARCPNAAAGPSGDLKLRQRDVDDAIQQYKAALRTVGTKDGGGDDLAPQEKALAAHVAQMAKSLGNAKMIIGSTKAIALSSNAIVAGAKAIGANADDETNERLLGGAKDLAEATNKLLQMARDCSQDPDNEDKHRAMCAQAGKVAQLAQHVTGDAGKHAAIMHLTHCAKMAAAENSALIAHAKTAGLKTDKPTAHQLDKAANDVADAIFNLVNSLANLAQDPKDQETQKALVAAAKQTQAPSLGLVAQAKSNAPKVRDDNVKYNLLKAADGAARAIQEVASALAAMEKTAESAELKEAMEALSATQADLDVAKILAQEGNMPDSGLERADAHEMLGDAARNLQDSQARLLEATRNDANAVGPAAKEVATAVTAVSDAVKATAGTIDDKYTQYRLVESAQDLADEISRLMGACRTAASHPDDESMMTMVDSAAGDVGECLDDLLATARGLNNADFSSAAAQISDESSRMSPCGGVDLVVAADKLSAASAQVDAAAKMVEHVTKSKPEVAGPAVKGLANKMGALTDAVNNAAGAQKDPQNKQKIIEKGQVVTQSAAALVEYSKAASASNAPSDHANVNNARRQLETALQDLHFAATPGQKELGEAASLVQEAVAALPVASMRGGTGRSMVNLNNLALASKDLAGALAQIVTAARANPDRLGQLSQTAAGAIDRMVKATGGDGGGGGDAGSGPQVVYEEVTEYPDWDDPYAAPSDALRNNLNTVRSEPPQQQLIAAAKAVGEKSQVILGQAKKDAATMDKEERAALLTSAKQLAQATSALPKAIKASMASGDKSEMHAAVDTLEAAVDAVNATKPQGPEPVTRRVAKTVPGSGGGGGDIDPDSIHVDPRLMDTILDHVRETAEETNRLIAASSTLSTKPKDAKGLRDLSSAAGKVGQSIASLQEARAEASPGIRECDQAVEQMMDGLADLDSLYLSVLMGDVPKPDGITYPQAREKLTVDARQVAQGIRKMLEGIQDPEKLGVAATEMGKTVPVMIHSLRTAVTTTNNKNTQKALLEQGKDLVDTTKDLVSAAREVALEQGDAKRQKEMQAKSKQTSDALTKLVTFLKTDGDSMKEIDQAIAIVKSAQQRVADGQWPTADRPYATARTELNKTTKEVIASVQSHTSACKGGPDRANANAKFVSAVAAKLVESTKSCGANTTDANVQENLGTACERVLVRMEQVLKDSKVLANDPQNPRAAKQIGDNTSKLTESISDLLAATRAGAVGEREVEAALIQVDQIIGDFDASALFAAAGELEGQGEAAGKDLGVLESEMQVAANNVIAAAQELAGASTGSQDAMGKAAKDYAMAMTDLQSSVKNTAALLPNVEVQQQMMASAKTAAVAAQTLVHRVQDAGKLGDASDVYPASDRFAETVNTMSDQCRAAVAEAAKGMKELDAAKGVIEELLAKYNKPGFKGTEDATAMSVVESARLTSASNAHIVEAVTANNQEKLFSAAQDAQKAIESLLNNSKGALKLTTDQQVRNKLRKSAADVATLTASVLGHAAKAASGGKGGKSKEQMADASKKLLEQITTVVDAANGLPGGGRLSLVEDMSEDVDAVAEAELQQAADVIARAADSLRNHQPKDIEAAEAFEVSVVGAIVSAATAIAKATGGLVMSAAVAQKERIAAGKNPATKHLYHKDPAWANGLISAAKEVAGATQQLTHVADKTVKSGKPDEDLLRAVSQEVAACTARLVSASRAKGDPTSRSQLKLSESSKMVAGATSALLEAAKAATAAEEEAREAANTKGDYTLSQSKIDAIELRAKILKLERELEVLREQEATLRKQRYQAENAPAKRGGFAKRGGAGFRGKKMGGGGPPRQ